MRRSLVLLVSILIGVAGCASLPPRPPAAPVRALTDVADTVLGRVAAASRAPGDPSLSGFRLLPEGETAFDARIALARRAQKSLDVQYYLIQNDDLGWQFLRELRDAALRGVRVRLLVDDLYTAGEDPLFTGLAATPGVEVRLFNPLPVRAGSFRQRLLFSLHEFARINHRMHNKLFIADNSFAVSGGRNIAAEYFMRSPEANFIDLDVVSSGPIVRELSAVFDAYWNSEHVYPIGSVAQAVAPAEARRRFDAVVGAARPRVDERANDVLGATPLAEQLDAGRVVQEFAPARVFADSPDKVAGAESATAGPTVTEQTLALFATATREVRVVSPYFVPGERGMAIIRAVGATEENGRIGLVTNSLGSTDEPLVYAGYARYRLDLLKAGVRIYEIGGSLARNTTRLGNFGRSISRLHAKVATIDNRILFIGSLNLDPRSFRSNTEVGLVIESPALAATASRLFRESLASGAYRLRLSADGEHIEWLETDEQGRQIVHTEEPDDDWLLRLKTRLLAPFVAEELL
ncbi:MAG: phospholipase D-like domain-containing protein [Caldimonas sp.]